MHLVEFVFIEFAYIPNFISNSKKLRKALPKVIKGHQRSICVFSKYSIHKTYVHINFDLNWSKYKVKTTKGYQRSPKVTKGQFVHLVKFVYIKFTYIPNFISNSKKLRKPLPKVTKGHQRSNHIFG